MDVVRIGLDHIITFDSEMKVCGSSHSLALARRILESQKPDLVIVDATMEVWAGLDFVKEIRQSAADIKLVVFSRSLDLAAAKRALKCGAVAVLLHDNSRESILEALIGVYSGILYVSPLIRLAEEPPNDQAWYTGESAFAANLSKREMAVFRMIGEGKTMKEMASELNLGVRTVETFKGRLRQKLGVKNTHQVKQLAFMSVIGQKSMFDDERKSGSEGLGG
jgi:DNA-binding NarL/FixJ family response regulator